MSRLARPNPVLAELNEQREQIAIELSLLAHSEQPDQAKLSALRQKLQSAEHRIAVYRPSEE
jgi:chaperonin cofactor prefoldin